MSNIIPIVSSSPPPMEESGFGWDDDDDDDFGNFASAPTAGSTVSSDSSFDVQWSTSQISLPTIEDDTVDDIKNESSFQEPEETSKGNIEPILSGHGQNDSVDAENFADFESNFQGFPPTGTETSSLASRDGETLSKPESIAIRSSSIEELDHEGQGEESDPPGRNTTVNESVYSNASTTDSGVFSSDLSPGPLPADSSDLCPKISSLNHCHNTEENSASKESLDSAVDVTSPSSSGDSESKVLQQISNAEHKEKEESGFDVQASSDEMKSSQPLDDSEGNKDENDDWGNFDSAFNNESNSCSVITQQDVSAFSDTDAERESSPGQSAITVTHSQKMDRQESDQEDDNVISTKNEADENKSIDKKNDSETEEHDLTHSDDSSSGLSSKVSPLSNSALNVEEREKGPDIPSGETSSDAVCAEGEKSAGSESVADTVRCEDSAIIVSQTTCDSNAYSDEEDDGWGDFDSGGMEEPQTNSSAPSELTHGEGHSHRSGDTSEHCEVRDDIPKKDLNAAVRSESPPAGERTEEKAALNSGCDDTLEHSDNSDSNLSEHIHQSTDSSAKSATDTTAKVDDDGGVPVDSGARAGHEGEDEEFGSFLDNRERKESDPSEEVAPIRFRTSICEPEVTGEGEDDFDFNRHNPPPFSDEGEEDDDEFGDFGQADQWDSNNGEEKNKENAFSSSGGDDNFGDFGSNEHGGDKEDGAGWADFGTASTSEAAEADGFGDFSHSEAAPAPSVKLGTEQSKLVRVEQALQKCFQSSEAGSTLGDDTRISETEDSSKDDKATSHGPSPLDTVVQLGTINPEEVKHQTWTVVQHPAKRDPKVKIWGQLKDVDSSHALIFGWGNSFCSKEVFNTLHIDTQNVLFSQKKQAVPFFASGLGILEPIRGGVENRKEKKAPLAQPVLLDTSKPDVKPVSGSSQDALPPVDFDWSTSGLTNPLSDEWDWVFKADQPDPTRSSLQPLEEIMRHSTPTAKLATHEVLSPEATRVLEKMPDLSFMQSRVLMFPVKN